jgi:hypothetical protein
MAEQIKSENWVKIGPLPGVLYAEMISEVLGKESIPFLITQDGVSTAYGIAGTNIAGNQAYIFVPREHENEVRKIIEQMIDHI